MEELLQETIRLKEVTAHSWLMINESNTNVGILCENPNSQLVALCESGKNYFNNRDSINEFFGKDLFDDVVKVQVEQKENFVNGFPVNFEDPVPVETVSEAEQLLPLYTKTADGTAIYAAGHYILHFPKGSLLAYCPKYSTLKKYDYEGPFKTELEVKTVLLQIKRNQKND